MRVLTHPTFVRAETWTTFIDDTPALFNLAVSQNRAQKVLSYLADLTVNGSSIAGQAGEPGLTLVKSLNLTPHLMGLQGGD